MARTLVRLLVPSPDRRRVLARPNGLAGWSLPVAVLADDPPATLPWPDDAVAAAARAVGTPVRPVRPIGAGAWEVEPLGRVPAVGSTWIDRAEAARLGADAGVVRRWAADGQG